jgi:hypothetical protein
LSKVAVPVKEGTLRVQATNSRSEFEVTTDEVGVVGHADAALLRSRPVFLVGGASAAQSTDAAPLLAVARPR